MRKIIVILVFTFYVLDVSSQYVKFGVESGYGFYQLNSLKDLQSDLSSFNNDLKAKVLEHFPNNIYYSLFLEVDLIAANSIGLECTYHSTGGRNQVKDYSGEYTLDLILNVYNYGVYYKNQLTISKKVNAFVGVGIGVVRSFLRIEEMAIINGVELESNENEMESTSFYWKPFAGFSYNLNEEFSVHLGAAYQYETINGLHLKDNEDAVLKTKNQKRIVSNCSGVRLFLGVTYKLFSHTI